MNDNQPSTGQNKPDEGGFKQIVKTFAGIVEVAQGIPVIIAGVLALGTVGLLIYCAGGRCRVTPGGPGGVPGVEIVRPNEETFIRQYWERVSDGDYEIAWEMVSPRFKCTFFPPCDDPDFESYAAGFENYEQVRVINAHIRQHGTQESTVELQLRYTFKDGTETTNGPFLYTLVAYKNSWQIDKVVFSSTD